MIEELLTIGLVLIGSSAWIFGVHCLLSDGYLLGELGRINDERLPNWLNKVLWRCPPCMASFHGTVIYMIFLTDFGFILWLPFIVCLCGFNYVVNQNT